MTILEKVVRLAAQGDGVTANGRHVPGGVPGDKIETSGALIAGPHRSDPPCRHFGRCGGCQLQHCDDEVLVRFVTDRVVNAALAQGLDPGVVLPAHLSPPRTRRRAVLHANASGNRINIGFREGGTHRIVDMRECHILLPELFALVAPLRRLLSQVIGRTIADVTLAQTDQGIDCTIKGLTVEGLAVHEELVAFARDRNLARLALDQGWGAEAVWEPEPVTISFAAMPVAFPPGAFLQATFDGEKVLQADVARFLAETRLIADLFAGLGTLSVPLAAQGNHVTAFEADKAAHLPCRTALSRLNNGRAIHRDLFRNPLRPDELRAFEAVIIDPPRAGAKAQIEQLAASEMPVIVYVSCNPASWARDGRVLLDAGYRLQRVRAVGQFRWSTHVELTSLFVR